MSDVIAALLRASLLTELGDDEERALRIRSAADSITSTVVNERPLDFASALLAAVDESGRPDVTILESAAAALEEQWETVRNAFPELPTELLRAILLQAVVSATDRRADWKGAAWYLLRMIGDQHSAGRWQPVLDSLFDSLDSYVSDACQEVWVPTPPASPFRVPSAQKVAEVPPTDTAAIEAARSVWDTHQEGQAWASTMAPQFADILGALTTSLRQTAVAADERSAKRLKETLTSLGDRLRATTDAQSQAVHAMTLRSNLLWWSQTRRSDSLGVRYEAIDDANALALAAAYDFHRLVVPLAPIAAEHLLFDVVTGCGAGLVNGAGIHAAAGTACADLDLPELPSAPALLLATARDSSAEPFGELSREMPAATAAVVLFRDMQIARLLSAPDGDD